MLEKVTVKLALSPAKKADELGVMVTATPELHFAARCLPLLAMQRPILQNDRWAATRRSAE